MLIIYDLKNHLERSDENRKRFVQVKLHSEVLRLLKFYKDFPILPSGK